MKPPRWLWIPVYLLALCYGCTSVPNSGTVDDVIPLEVVSTHWNDWTVFVELSPGSRVRIGRTTGLGTTRHRIRTRVLVDRARVRLVAVELASRRVVLFDPVSVDGSVRLVLYLSSRPEQSALAVYPR